MAVLRLARASARLPARQFLVLAAQLPPRNSRAGPDPGPPDACDPRCFPGTTRSFPMTAPDRRNSSTFPVRLPGCWILWWNLWMSACLMRRAGADVNHVDAATAGLSEAGRLPLTSLAGDPPAGDRFPQPFQGRHELAQLS